MTLTFNATLKKVCKDLSPFLWVWIVFSILLGTLLLQFGYYDSFLFLNSFRNPLLDSFMPHFTHLGEGVVLAVIFSLFIWKKDQALVNSLLLGLVVMALVLYALKHYVFIGWNRPPIVFRNLADFYYLSLGGERFNSFPSGHSAAIWLVMTFIAYFFREQSVWKQILCALLAVSVAFSRVYIGVHFPGDILTGSFIGTGIAVLTLSIHYPPTKIRLEQGKLNLGFMKYFILAVLIFSLLVSTVLIYMQYYSL